MTLLPCAHCGGEANGGNPSGYIIFCRDCGISTGPFGRDEFAAAIWNRRPELVPTPAPVTLRDVFAAALVAALAAQELSTGEPHKDILSEAYSGSDILLANHKPNETETKT